MCPPDQCLLFVVQACVRAFQRGRRKRKEREREKRKREKKDPECKSTHAPNSLKSKRGFENAVHAHVDYIKLDFYLFLLPIKDFLRTYVQ